MRYGRTKGSREWGLSVLELLIAMTILIVAAMATLELYHASWRSFAKGEGLALQQQTVRVGFGKVIADLRMAGFNHNPDGDAGRPDERIEAAYDTAIVVRADFDAQDATESLTPENLLAGGPFDSVPIGNDEIVAYVLARQDGSSSDTLTFAADVKDEPRDGIAETVGVPNVALTHDDPPYTLYRVTFSNDTSDWGTDDFHVFTPLADNIMSMSYRYFTSVGQQINTFDLATTSDDIGGGELALDVATRAAIHRIEVSIVGLARDPDPQWFDPDDSNPATKSYRKFLLSGDVTPRNTGLIGVADLP